MASLKIIKKRIASVKSTQKITRAMKLVSAAKLRRATDKAHGSRPYEQELLKIVTTILSETTWTSPLMENREVRRVAIIAVSSDRGLCGSLNANIIKKVQRRVQELGAGTKVDLIGVGKKAVDFLRKRGASVRAVHTDILRSTSVESLRKITQELRELYLKGEYDRVEIVFSKFQSALIQTPTLSTLLPFTIPTLTKNKSEGMQKPYILEPLGPELLESLVPMLIDFQLYQAVLESIASEHGARMAAMEAATKNARDMIDRLTLERNRARQAAITKELMEIIGGAEALSA